ncbi:MAG: PEGA domain-containing protein [Lachnospiraceae bacterium]|nr:PEGA domain-containing protein [Lachnospiraceae bacterium]
MYKRLSGIVTIIMILVLVITGCTSQASNIGLAKEGDQTTVGTDFVVAEVGSYDSADTAVVLSVDTDIEYITFMNIATGKQYTLSYDGTTYVKDKYEGPMTISQIKAGDIVDITFLKGRKRLASVQLSPQAWVYSGVENYDLGGINKTATIGSETYSLPDQVVVLSEGQRKEIMDIVEKDILTISGIGHDIYSISVEKGHGYLRLSNDSALIGGWIEVGNAVIQQISENMLLAVPEGSYQVIISNGNVSSVKEVVIERNKEVIVDVGDVVAKQDKTGKILFSVDPSMASVSIDGEVVDISKEVELTYGIHKVHMEAEGYQTLTKYIQVGSEYATISFTMEEGNTEEGTNSVSDNSSTDEVENAVTGNKVYIDAPKEVEVYLDGSYVGISPVSFTKVTGSHTITLRKTGYESRSYTIYLYNDGEDVTYSFADLEPDGFTVSGNRSVTSGSSTSLGTTSSSTMSSKTTETVSGNNSN